MSGEKSQRMGFCVFLNTTPADGEGPLQRATYCVFAYWQTTTANTTPDEGEGMATMLKTEQGKGF